jgi:ABC-type transporter Mla subunit MlaD
MAINKEFWAGMFVLTGILGGIGLYATLVVDTAVSTFSEFRLDAKDVTGIEVGTPVVMAGYNLGKVKEITVIYEPSLTFDVTLSLKPEVKIPSDVVVQMGTRLAGGGLINFVPPESITGYLEPGSTLELQPSTDIQSLLDSADSILSDLAIITQRGREFVEDPEQGLELRLKEVDGILIEVNALLDELTGLAKSSRYLLNTSTPALNQTLANTETLTQDSVVLLSQMDASLKSFDTQMVALGELMESYDPQSNRDMDEIFESLGAASQSLDRLMSSMETGPLRTLRKGVDASTTVQEITKPSNNPNDESD